MTAMIDQGVILGDNPAIRGVNPLTAAYELVRAELRSERIAIMMHDAGLTEEQAQAECDKQPELYGTR